MIATVVALKMLNLKEVEDSRTIKCLIRKKKILSNLVLLMFTITRLSAYDIPYL